MKELTTKTTKNILDDTWTVELMDGDITMATRNGLEECEIFVAIVELTQMANKHGYTVA